MKDTVFQENQYQEFNVKVFVSQNAESFCSRKWKTTFLTLFSVFWSRNFQYFATQINPTHLHSMTKYSQKLLNVFAGETVWHYIVSILTFLSYKWRRICFKSCGKNSPWETSYFQQYIFFLADYLYQYPTILIKIFVGLDFVWA